MSGEITGVFADGIEVRFWSMFMFYNPVTQQVLYQQVGRNGTLISAQQPVREQALDFGEVERLDATEYSSDGYVKTTRHENVFYDDGSHTSKVYEQDATGEWKQVNEWRWQLTPPSS